MELIVEDVMSNRMQTLRMVAGGVADEKRSTLPVKVEPCPGSLGWWCPPAGSRLKDGYAKLNAPVLAREALE